MCSIQLSGSFGVNRSVELCFYCAKPKGAILFGKMHRNKAERLFGKDAASLYSEQDVAMPQSVCINREPCKTCGEWMRQGCLFISARDCGDMDNPQRTGGFAVLKDEALDALPLDPDARDDILRSRFCFVEDTMWRAMGLPPLDEKHTE